MLNDVVYYVEPVNNDDCSSLTSAHYVIAADRFQPPSVSCGRHAVLTIEVASVIE